MTQTAARQGAKSRRVSQVVSHSLGRLVRRALIRTAVLMLFPTVYLLAPVVFRAAFGDLGGSGFTFGP